MYDHKHGDCQRSYAAGANNGPQNNKLDCIEKDNGAITLSIPGTPNPLANRRPSSGIQMSAKLEALRGVSVNAREEAPSNGDRQNNNSRKKNDKNKKKTVRFMQKNGRCNIRQDSGEIHKRYLRDIFTTLVDMRWRSNLLFFIATYLVAWSFFGLLWWIVAFVRGDVTYHYQLKANVTVQQDQRESCVENVYSYTTAFLFFVETETSLGYGKRAITAKCPEAIILFVVQSLLASILDAFMIGTIFIKISQPKNRAETLVFSEHCVISPRDRKYCLMFRVGNLRNSLIVQCRIRAKYVKSRETKEGEFIGLHQDDINVGFDTGADNLFLVTPLIICHEIDERSPFWTMTADDLRQERFEIIVILEGMIESTGMICQARTSYLNSEILWGHRFMPVLFHARGHFRVDHSEFHSIYEVSMPRMCMSDYQNNNKEESNNGPSQKLGPFESPTSKGLSGVQKQCRGGTQRQPSAHRSVKHTAMSQDTLRANSMDSFKVKSATMRTLSEANVCHSVAVINEEPHASSSFSARVHRRHQNSRDEYAERRKSDEAVATLLKSGADMAL